MVRENTTSTINQLSVQMAKIGEQIKNIEDNQTRIEIGVNDVKKKLESEYATREWTIARCEKYENTSKIVAGILVTFGSAIIIAIATFIINGGLK